jgi:FHA domain
MDPGSENGTIVNEVEIRPGQPKQLRSSDSICIGAWTSIVIVETTA